MKKPHEFNLQALTPEDTERACTSKRWYASKNAARDDAKRIAKAKGDAEPMNPYRCPVCHRWHLSSVPKEFAPDIRNRQRRKIGLVPVMRGNAA